MSSHSEQILNHSVNVILRSELDAPLPDRFLGHDHAARSEQIFDIVKTQTESMVKPDRAADDLRWESVLQVAGASRFHPDSLRDLP